MTREQALEKKFLEKKYVYLKLLPKPNALTKDPSHVAYGGFDGSVREYTIGVDKYNRLINPFETEEEQKYFEDITKQNLSVYSPENKFWDEYKYKFVKDLNSIKLGVKFDLSDPNQMLDYKVLKTNTNIVCPDMATLKSKPNPFFELVFVDADYEEIEASVEMDENKKVFMFFGKMEDSPTKMRDFLNIYYLSNMKTNQATEMMSKEALHKEISKIIKEDRKGYIEIMEDPNYETKQFILKALDKGAIIKEGFTYQITGEATNFSYMELIMFLNKLREDSDMLYGKIEAQIRSKK